MHGDIFEDLHTYLPFPSKNVHLWMGAYDTSQQMLRINGRFLGWSKKFFLCSGCDARVGHASKPNPIPVAAGMSLEGCMLGGWSSSPAHLCRLCLTGSACGLGSLSPPSLTVIETSTDVHQTEHLLTPPEHFAFRLHQKQNKSLQLGGRSAQTC